jgi:hypothetical protein
MSRTPIIIPGQVYLHPQLNEYLVVTRATRGDIQFKGPGFSGMNEVELFLERFGPVDPADLDEAECNALLVLLNTPCKLSVGWVQPDEDDIDGDDDL